MDAELQVIEKDFLDRTGKVSKQWGLGEPVGRVWAALTFSGTPLSQREIAKKTGYSPGLVSSSLKIIEKLEMARTTKGSGKERLYTASTTITEAFSRVVLHTVSNDMRSIVRELEHNDSSIDANQRARFAQLAKEYKQLDARIALCDKIILADEATIRQVRQVMK